MIEISTDCHRRGLLPEADLLLNIGHIRQSGGAHLHGVLTHAGASCECRTPEALQDMAEQERSRRLRAAERLRAGVYVLHDLVMHGVDVCATDEIALGVLCTVIGHQPDKAWVMASADQEHRVVGGRDGFNGPGGGPGGALWQPNWPGICPSAAACACCPTTPAPRRPSFPNTRC